MLSQSFSLHDIVFESCPMIWQYLIAAFRRWSTFTCMVQQNTALWAIFLNLMFRGRSSPNFFSLIEHSGFSLQKEWYVASIVFSRILKHTCSLVPSLFLTNTVAFLWGTTQEILLLLSKLMTLSVKIGSNIVTPLLDFCMKKYVFNRLFRNCLEQRRRCLEVSDSSCSQGSTGFSNTGSNYTPCGIWCFYLLYFKLERISFGISSDCEFITASCIVRAEFRDWELITVFITTAFFDGDFSQLMLSVISLTLLRVVVERFLNGNLKFNMTWNGEFWLFFLLV